MCGMLTQSSLILPIYKRSMQKTVKKEMQENIFLKKYDPFCLLVSQLKEDTLHNL